MGQAETEPGLHKHTYMSGLKLI